MTTETITPNQRAGRPKFPHHSRPALTPNHPSEGNKEAVQNIPVRVGHVSPISEYMPARLVAARYALTIRSIDRWTEDPRKGFPPPVYLGRMRFWRVADLEAWEAAQDERGAA